jgi:hypothetical protein
MNNNYKMTQHIQYLGDFANRVSSFVKPEKVEMELSQRQFLMSVEIIQKRDRENKEIKFMYKQFQIDEISKRLKNPKVVCSPMSLSSLSMGKLVKIRNRARMAVNRLFAEKQLTLCNM